MHHDLARFLAAQEPQVDAVLDELRRGRKLTHWMWYFFPQLQGLGRSSTAQFYGITSLSEAQAYLQHGVLGPRLRECVKLMMGHADKSAELVLGLVDALKFRSCLTLFDRVSDGDPLFRDALRQFFNGEPDPLTLQALGGDQ